MLNQYALILVRNGWRVEPNDLAEDLSTFSVIQKTNEDISLHEQTNLVTTTEGSQLVDLQQVRPEQFTPSKKRDHATMASNETQPVLSRLSLTQPVLPQESAPKDKPKGRKGRKNTGK